MKTFDFTLAEAQEIMRRRPRGAETDSFKKDASEHWDEGLGYKKSMRALRSGVERERLRSLSHQLSQKLSAHIGRVETERPSQRGKRLDKTRYRQGRPKCTWKRQRSAGTLQAAEIEVDAGASGSVGSDVFIQRGAAVLALLQEARRQGISTEVYVVDPTEGEFRDVEHRTCKRVLLSRAGESAHQQVMNFALAHSAFLRRVMFRLTEEIAQQNGWEVSWGYGRAIHEKPDTGSDLFIPGWESTKEPKEVIDIATNWTKEIS